MGPHRASGPTSISHSPFMDSKKDGLQPVVRPALPQDGRTGQFGTLTLVPQFGNGVGEGAF